MLALPRKRCTTVLAATGTRLLQGRVPVLLSCLGQTAAFAWVGLGGPPPNPTAEQSDQVRRCCI
jgi:hypothetical protein